MAACSLPCTNQKWECRPQETGTISVPKTNSEFTGFSSHLRIHNGKFLNSYNTHWGVLRRNTLEIYKGSNGMTPYLKLPLAGSSISVRDEKTFVLCVPLRKSKLRLRVTDEALLCSWVSSLRTAIADSNLYLLDFPSQGQMHENSVQSGDENLHTSPDFEKAIEMRQTKIVEESIHSKTECVNQKQPMPTHSLTPFSHHSLGRNNKISQAACHHKISLQDFEPLGILGEGSFGKVFKVQHKTTHRISALKIIRKSESLDLKLILSERQILLQLRHPFLIRLEAAFQTPQKLCFLMPYLPNGSLSRFLTHHRRLPEPTTALYAAQLLCALSHLHSHGIIYRDLKPDNVVFNSEGHCVLTDMGLARTLLLEEAQQAYTFCGTPLYLAPEVIRRKGYGPGVDYWALGVMVYEMLLGSPPFGGSTPGEVFAKIIAEPVALPIGVLSPAACDLLRLLLRKNPMKRVTGASLLKKHAFFQGIDWEGLSRVSRVPGDGAAPEGVLEPMTASGLRQWREEVVLSRSGSGTTEVLGFTYEAEEEEESGCKEEEKV